MHVGCLTGTRRGRGGRVESRRAQPRCGVSHESLYHQAVIAGNPHPVILSILVFLSVRFIPGDVIDVMQSRMGGLERVDREQLEQMLGLDSRSTCSMAAGWEISCCTAPLGAH